MNYTTQLHHYVYTIKLGLNFWIRWTVFLRSRGHPAVSNPLLMLNQCFQLSWIVSVPCYINCEHPIAAQLVLRVCERKRSDSTVNVPRACPLKKKGSITTCTITAHHIDTECDRTCTTLSVRILHHILLCWCFRLQKAWNCDFSDKQRVSKKLVIRNDPLKNTYGN